MTQCYYTSVEQSKKLLELGLNPESADMRWTPCQDEHEKWFIAENKRIVLNYDKKHCIPCWSLGALLALMPISIKTDNGEYHYSMCRGGRGAYTFYYKHGLKEPWDIDYEICCFTGESMIDAAFEMVVWLIENGHIKVEK